MRRAFSLIELLVVIGIVGLLLAVLLPTLARARESARSIKCLSNLRQMVIAAENYAIGSHGYYPPAQWNTTRTPKWEWDFAWNGAAITPGVLWQGHTSAAVQQCPSFNGKNNSPSDPFTGYNYNTSFIGRGYREGAPAKLTDVRHPSQTVIFGDGEWKAGANKYMRSPRPSPTEDPFVYAEHSAAKAAGTQGFRHRGRTNAAFCDGHAESLPRPAFNAGRPDVTPTTGFLSPDNSLYDLD